MVQAVIPTTVVGLQGRAVAATPAPTNNQALIWNGTAWVPGGPYLTAAGAPYIATNYADNSGFTVNQRGYASGTALAAGAYGFDRWKAGASGCTLTYTASPGSTVVTISAGTLQQVIEAANQINSTYTLSWLGSATGRVNTGAYVASPIQFTGAANTAVTIEFQGGTLGQVQLQIGNQVTLWQPSPFQVEIARCQRFYLGVAYYIYAGWAGPGNASAMNGIVFPVQMRSTPTIALSGIAPSGVSTGMLIFTVNPQNFSGQVQTNGNTGTFGLSFAYTASADL